ALGTVAAPSSANLAVDLSSHLISITTGFTGTDLLLFGATPGEGDIIVVVRGPATRVDVRRKVRVAGIWVNGPSAEFEDVPALYILSSSRPVDELLRHELRRALGIGFDAFPARTVEPLKPGEVGPFRDALIRRKQALGLYSSEVGVRFVQDQLFRTTISFPASVPTGEYRVDVYLIDDGKVANMQATPLAVTKAGIGAKVFEFAHRYSALYGIIAVLLALFAGWLANALFRRS
ncbi:MAG: TIGR02186 family protein, partial [Acetobacterales bacterium]